MLEKIPPRFGHALRSVRAGFDKIVSEQPPFASLADLVRLESPAFEDGTSIPARYTADGDRVSPPLRWTGPIEDAEGLVLIVEDPDAPTPDPLVHLIAWDLIAERGELPEGQFKSPHHAGLDETLGRNAYFQAAWLPPDPPRGHGPHLYVFQMFALSRRIDFHRPPSRAELVRAMKAAAPLAKGLLTGVYERP